MSRKSVYLDTNIWVAAQRSMMQGDLSLVKAIEELSVHSDLCFSFVHIMELSLGAQNERLKRELFTFAKWLDSLPLSFMRKENRIQDEEVKQLYVSKMGGPIIQPPPISKNFWDLMEKMPDPGNYDPVRDRATIEVYLRQTLATPDNVITNAVRTMVTQISRVRRDWDDNNVYRMERSHVYKVLLGKTYDSIKERCHDFYKNRNIRFSAEELRLLVAPGASGLIEPILKEPTFSVGLPELKSMPLWYLSQITTTELSYEIRQISLEVFRERVRSDPFDQLHIQGAAYCDYFTCDKRTHRRLDGPIKNLGKNKPLFVASRGEGFATPLELIKYLISKVRASEEVHALAATPWD